RFGQTSQSRSKRRGPVGVDKAPSRLHEAPWRAGNGEKALRTVGVARTGMVEQGMRKPLEGARNNQAEAAQASRAEAEAVRPRRRSRPTRSSAPKWLSLVLWARSAQKPEKPSRC